MTEQYVLVLMKETYCNSVRHGCVICSKMSYSNGSITLVLLYPCPLSFRFQN